MPLQTYSRRPWREIARQMVNENDFEKRRALMHELNDALDPRLSTCAICSLPCDLTTCKTDEQGRAVHEHCYLSRV